jgi:methionine-gamma-lyase
MTPFDPIASMAKVRHEFGEHGGVNMSIEDSTTFTVMRAGTMPDIFHGVRGPEEGCFLYGRHFNPTVYVLGKQLAAMEGTEAAYATSSGMSAIAATILQLIRQGDHAVVSSTIYGGTFALLQNYLPEKTGLRVTCVDVTDHAKVEAAFTPNTRFLYVETLGNPTLVVADLPRLAKIAHRHNAKLLVDNTFCPMVVSPAQHGADVVLHSLTKFASGASDVIAGAVCADRDFITQLMDVTQGGLMLLGPTMDPFVAAKLSLRLPHLGIRMVEHGRRAQVFAERLQERGETVIYPGLPSHPQHALFERLVNPGLGMGGIFDVDLGSAERANRLMELLQNRDHFGMIAVSLGYFDTLMSCSASSTSSEMPEEDQKKAHISPGLVRFSIGYTGTLEQRWSEFEDALEQLGAHAKV